MANWLQQAKGEPLTGGEPVRDPSVGNRVHKESMICAGLTFEGKIKGQGNIGIGGNYQGDIQVEGNVAIEAGAEISGEIVADNVTIAGNVEGNITASNHVKLLESCKLIGDLKASSLTVAAGSRMRGMVEFGWEKPSEKVAPLKIAVKEDLETKIHE
ncbi:MAG: hypothetical protein GTO40_00365 [Deltaproteobacteria bacterium]|nr:hypothetical protein [Deltaproteobacteria bacterium]